MGAQLVRLLYIEFIEKDYKMAIPNVPIYAPYAEQINGLGLTFLSGTTLRVAAGQCSNSTIVNQIVLGAAVTVNAAVNGANGLDSGDLANSTIYAVHVIADSTKANASAAMLSLSGTAPALPAGYDMSRRVGYVLTSGAGAIVDFAQRGNGNNRHMMYANRVATDITAGASATFAAVDASASVPVDAVEVALIAVLTADAGGTRTAALREVASTSTAGQVVMSAAASTAVSMNLVCPCGASGSVQYLVSNAAAAIALSVIGYTDAL